MPPRFAIPRVVANNAPQTSPQVSLQATEPEPLPAREPTPQHISVLKAVFGLPGFRDKQYDACLATLERRDSIVILPTGAGKSLTFQFPPYARSRCFTVVVGPLLALMKDQVEKCLDLGLDASVYNSDCTEQQKRSLLSDLVSEDPSVRLVYTTPESLMQPRLRDALKIAYEQGTLLSFAIDEAHCISDWGHDFRPKYLELQSLKTDFPSTPITALSATCTPKVQESIIKLLKLHGPAIIKASFNRPNIQYVIRYKDLLGDASVRPLGSDDDCLDDLAQFLQARHGECGIIYARTRAACDWLSRSLNGMDIEVGCYHAGKDSNTRQRVQRDWSQGAIQVVVATIAFGMGIDRSDVRWVVHWNVPSSVEGFMQESGRAGRDGQPSISVVYMSQADLQNSARLQSGSKAGGIEAITHLCMDTKCRRQTLLKHFNESRGPCGAVPGELPCDVCRDAASVRRCLTALDKVEQSSSRAAAMRAHMDAQRASGGHTNTNTPQCTDTDQQRNDPNELEQGSMSAHGCIGAMGTVSQSGTSSGCGSVGVSAPVWQGNSRVARAVSGWCSARALASASDAQSAGTTPQQQGQGSGNPAHTGQQVSSAGLAAAGTGTQRQGVQMPWHAYLTALGNGATPPLPAAGSTAAPQQPQQPHQQPHQHQTQQQQQQQPVLAGLHKRKAEAGPVPVTTFLNKPYAAPRKRPQGAGPTEPQHKHLAQPSVDPVPGPGGPGQGLNTSANNTQQPQPQPPSPQPQVRLAQPDGQSVAQASGVPPRAPAIATTATATSASRVLKPLCSNVMNNANSVTALASDLFLQGAGDKGAGQASEIALVCAAPTQAKLGAAAAGVAAVPAQHVQVGTGVTGVVAPAGMGPAGLATAAQQTGAAAASGGMAGLRVRRHGFKPPQRTGPRQ